MVPDFVQELAAFLEAEGKYQEWERKQAEAKAKAGKN